MPDAFTDTFVHTLPCASTGSVGNPYTKRDSGGIIRDETGGTLHGNRRNLTGTSIFDVGTYTFVHGIIVFLWTWDAITAIRARGH